MHACFYLQLLATWPSLGIVTGAGVCKFGMLSLALMLHMPMSDATVPQNQWIALNRGGAVTQLTSGDPILDLVDAPGGYITLTANSNMHTLSHHVLGNETDNTLWQSEFDGWQIVWSSQYPAPMDLAPFVSIG